MKVPVSPLIKRWIIVMLLPTIVGCSALRLSYNQGPWLAYWWLDSQLEFTADQAPQVRSALADWFDWHRATQLPDYAQALGEVGQLAVNPVTPELVCRQIEAWQRRAERAFDRAVPALAVQVRGLSPEQIDHLARRQARKQQEMVAEYRQDDLAQRRQASLARTVERAETFYGRLDEAQRQMLAAGLAASPFDAERWLAERSTRNAELIQSLRQWQQAQADTATVQAGLRRLAAAVRQSPRADYDAYSRRLAQANCQLMAQLHNSTSATQRQHAADKLRGWQADLQALAGPR